MLGSLWAVINTSVGHGDFCPEDSLKLAVSLSGAGIARAEQLDYAYGYPAGSAADNGAKSFANDVEERSGGDLTIRNFPLSLLSLAEITDGVRDGRADIGFFLAIYDAAEFPTYLLLADLNKSPNLADGQHEWRDGLSASERCADPVRGWCIARPRSRLKLDRARRFVKRQTAVSHID